MADDGTDYDEMFQTDPGAVWQLPTASSDLLDRRARVRLGHQHLLDMLQLPPGTQIKALVPCLDPPGVDVVIVNEALPVVDRDAESPVFGNAAVTVHSYCPGDGYIYTRSSVEWPLPTGAI